MPSAFGLKIAFGLQHIHYLDYIGSTAYVIANTMLLNQLYEMKECFSNKFNMKPTKAYT